MTDVPREAVTAAMKAAPDRHLGFPGGWEPAVTEPECRRMLEAALPAIREAERERLVHVLHKLREVVRHGTEYPFDGVAWSHILSALGSPVLAGIDVKGEITAEQVDELKARWKAAWQSGRPELMTDTHIAPDPCAARVAVLEQLAADILATFSRGSFYSDGAWRTSSDPVRTDQIACWHATLNGETP